MRGDADLVRSWRKEFEGVERVGGTTGVYIVDEFNSESKGAMKARFKTRLLFKRSLTYTATVDLLSSTTSPRFWARVVWHLSYSYLYSSEAAHLFKSKLNSSTFEPKIT
jgi:hypothetical protein